jgi:hypothetical protein
MGGQRMSHTVTITRLPDNESDDYGYAFGGTHGSDCEVFDRCGRKACQSMDPFNAAGDERNRHGRFHFHRDGEWLVQSDACALRFVFEQYGDIETFNGLTLGSYAVRVEWEDDTWWLTVGERLPDSEVASP